MLGELQEDESIKEKACQYFSMLASIFSRKEEARSSAESNGEEVLRKEKTQNDSRRM